MHAQERSAIDVDGASKFPNGFEWLFLDEMVPKHERIQA